MLRFGPQKTDFPEIDTTRRQASPTDTGSKTARSDRTEGTGESNDGTAISNGKAQHRKRGRSSSTETKAQTSHAGDRANPTPCHL